MALGRPFRSLRSRNYRLYILGQAISRSGTWLQLVAENWLVLQLGGGGIAVGVTTALYFAPLLVFGPYGGALVDRSDTRGLLTVTQITNGLLALALGALVLGGLVQIWMIWSAAFLTGCVNSLDNPGGQALTKQVVGLTDIANATALSTAVAGGARAIGPAIGGLVLAAAGPGACFLVNAASYGVVAATLRIMRGDELVTTPTAVAASGPLGDGFGHVLANRGLWTVLLIVAIVNTFGVNYQVLLTVLVARVFHLGPASYGVTMSALGIGWLTGSVLAASWNDPTAPRVGVLAVMIGAGSAAVAAAPTFALTVAAVTVMGAVTGLFVSSTAGYLQVRAPEDLRGRIMALYFMAFLGVSLIGGPLMGWVAEALGPRTAFLLAAVPCGASACLAFYRTSVPDVSSIRSPRDF
jgi:MFS family permease